MCTEREKQGTTKYMPASIEGVREHKRQVSALVGTIHILGTNLDEAKI
jgi:hypothetical protein